MKMRRLVIVKGMETRFLSCPRMLRGSCHVRRGQQVPDLQMGGVLTRIANVAMEEAGGFYADSEREFDRHSGQLGGIELLRVLHDRMDFEASLES